ncbi:MAG: polymer-forming cytoskeletal protein [Bacillota bacterium]
MFKGKRFILSLAVLLLFLLAWSGVGLAQEREGDVLQLVGDIVITEGQVIEGNVVNLKGNITVSGKVLGDVFTMLGNITLKDTAQVLGDVVVLKGDVIRSEGAVIGGNIVSGGQISNLRFGDRYTRITDQSGRVEYYLPNNQVARQHYATSFAASILQLLGLLGLAAIGISVFPKYLGTMAAELRRDILRIFLVGLAGWVIYPFVMLVFAVTIIGIPVTILMALLVPVIILIGTVIIAIALGGRLRNMLSSAFNWAKEANLLIEGLLGILALWLVSKAPFVGWLVIPAVAIFGLGVILTTKFGTNKPWFKKKEARPINEAEPINNENMQKNNDIQNNEDIQEKLEEPVSGEEGENEIK